MLQPATMSVPPKRARLAATAPDALCWLLFAAFAVAVLAVYVYQPPSGDDFAIRIAARKLPAIGDFLDYMFKNWGAAWPVYLLRRVFAENRALAGVANWLALFGTAALTVVVSWGRGLRLRRADLSAVAFVSSALWLALPAMAATVLPASTAATYLWPAFLALAFAAPYSAWMQSPRAPKRSALVALLQAVAMLALGFTAGSASQQVATALFAVIIGCALFVARRWPADRPPPHLAAGALGVALGAMLVSFAPGAVISAAQVTTQASFGEWLTPVGEFYRSFFLEQTPRLFPWLALPLMLAVGRPRIAAGETQVADPTSGTWPVWLLAAPIATLPFVAVPAHANSSAMLLPVLLTFVCALSLLGRDGIENVIVRAGRTAFSAVIALLVLFAASSAIGAARVTRSVAIQTSARIALIERERDRGVADITVPALDIPQTHGVFVRDIGSDPTAPANRTLAEWYGVKSVRTR